MVSMVSGSAKIRRFVSKTCVVTAISLLSAILGVSARKPTRRHPLRCRKTLRPLRVAAPPLRPVPSARPTTSTRRPIRSAMDAPGANVNFSSDLRGGVASDGQGNIYIADTSNNMVRKYDPRTGLVSRVVGKGTSCAAALDNSGDGCPSLQTSTGFHASRHHDRPPTERSVCRIRHADGPRHLHGGFSSLPQHDRLEAGWVHVSRGGLRCRPRLPFDDTCRGHSGFGHGDDSRHRG